MQSSSQNFGSFVPICICPDECTIYCADVSEAYVSWTYCLDFMALCHSLNAVSTARSLWHDQQFMEVVEYVDPISGGLGMNMPSITDTYLVTLSLC